MDRLRRVADEVATAFEDRKRARWQLTAQWLRGEPTLRRYVQLVEERVDEFAAWQLDRQELFRRLRGQFDANPWAVTFEAGAAEVQEMAREAMWHFLIDSGVPPEDARTIAWSYSVGALLHND